MPTCQGKETTVQLSVADLDLTTTQKPLTKLGPVATEGIRTVAQEFARGSKNGTLTETLLSTEDECYRRYPVQTPLSTEEKSSVGFLGNPPRMTFFMVHAGNNFFDLTTKENRNRRPCRVPWEEKIEEKSASTADDTGGKKIEGKSGTHKDFDIEPDRNYEPPRKPHALCLTVFLSNKSFFRLKNNSTGRNGFSDLKIDVFSNGALCDSQFIPSRYYNQHFAMTEHIIRFTGRRIGRLIEKPWIIVPSGQNPDGSPREYRNDEAAYAGVQQRWKDISDALMTEADKNGRNARGERPVIGEYLESLAQLSMPKEVEDMQKAGGTKFGILDVVILWGKGIGESQKASFLVEPTPIRNEGFIATNLDQPMDLTPVQAGPKTTDSPSTAPKSKQLVSAKFINGDSHASTHLPLPLTPTQTTNPISNTNSSTPSPPKRRLQPEDPQTRSPGHYRDPLTKGPTLEEQFNSIAAATDFDPKTGHSPSFMNHTRTTRYSNASTAGSSPLSSAPTTRDPSPPQAKIAKLQISSPMKSATSSSSTKTPRMKDEEAEIESMPPPTAQTPASRSKRRIRYPTPPSAKALDREFLTPTLSGDCVITYAQTGTLRNVVGARERVFREEGVVMGARFIIGG